MSPADALSIRAMPGSAGADQLGEFLAWLDQQLTNLPGRYSGHAHDLLNGYLTVIDNACRVLRGHLHPDDLERLLLTPRYRLLAGGGMPASQFYGNITVEIDDRRAAIQQLTGAISAALVRWGTSRLVVVDTSAFYNSPAEFASWDIRSAIPDLTAGHTLHLIIPMVVADELDRLKDSKDRHQRWRARHTLRDLHAILGRGITAPLTEGTDRVSVEILVDPLGHQRLPDNDDEILDRALLVQCLASRPVSVLTSDYGMLWRATALNLNPIHLLNTDQDTSRQEPQPPEPQPPATTDSTNP